MEPSPAAWTGVLRMPWPTTSTVNRLPERDRFFMAMLAPLGIEKGKPFNPDTRSSACYSAQSLPVPP